MNIHFKRRNMANAHLRFMPCSEAIFCISPFNVAMSFLRHSIMSVNAICDYLFLRLYDFLCKAKLRVYFQILPPTSRKGSLYMNDLIWKKRKPNFISQSCFFTKFVGRIGRIWSWQPIKPCWFLYGAVCTINGYRENLILISTPDSSISPFDLIRVRSHFVR